MTYLSNVQITQDFNSIDKIDKIIKKVSGATVVHLTIALYRFHLIK